MAMTVAHNSSSALALNELNKNNSRLAKDLKRVSSGVRITGAADGTSEYAISEKMRVMVRALNQDIDNSKKGIDLVKVAEGGIQNIIDELRDMKAMALNSANGHNTNIDRAIIQKEFASRMEEINDIASTTNYNGRILLDGTYWYREHEELIPIPDDAPVQMTPTSNSTNALHSSSNLAAANTMRLSASRSFAGPMFSVINNNKVLDTDASVESSPAVSFATKATASNFALLGAQETENVIFDPLGGFVPNQSIGLFPSPTAPYTIAKPCVHRGYENELDTSSGYSPIPYARFNDFPNYNDYGFPCLLRQIGLGEAGGGSSEFEKCYMYENADDRDSNMLRTIPPVGTTVWLKSGRTTAVNEIPRMLYLDGKYQIAEEPGTGRKIIYNQDLAYAGRSLPILCSYTCEEIDFSNVSCSIPDGLNNKGFTIQCDGCMEYISIRFDSERDAGTGIRNIGELPMNAIQHVPIEQYKVYSYVVGIKGVTNSDDLESALFRGLLNAVGGTGTGGVQLNPHHNVSIRYIDGKYYLTKNWSAESTGLRMIIKEGVMGTLSGGNTTATGGTPGGGDTVPGGGGDDTTPGGGDTVPGGGDTVPGGGGDDTTPGGGDTVPGGGGDDTTPGGGEGDTVPGGEIRYYRRRWVEGNPLIIHTGPKQNQNLAIHINDMHTDAMGLKDVAVDPFEKALEAIDKLDEALEYALTENTRMGAYQVRLQATIDNLTTEHENVMASESVIRDADMAKEMVSYLRDNILSQAAQAMLAQANQNGGMVLRLLQ